MFCVALLARTTRFRTVSTRMGATARTGCFEGTTAARGEIVG